MIFKILKIKSAEKFFLFFFNYSLNINTWSLYFTLHKSEVYSDHITWIIVICDWKKNVAVERAIIETKKSRKLKKNSYLPTSWQHTTRQWRSVQICACCPGILIRCPMFAFYNQENSPDYHNHVMYINWQIFKCADVFIKLHNVWWHFSFACLT